MSNQLAGKVALISGGGRGIGRAIALAFAREGALVAVAARSSDELAETVWLIQELGGQGLALTADVRSVEQVTALVEHTGRELGPIDVLVNSAGVGWRAPIEETGEAAWDAVVDTLLKGTYLLCRACLPGMTARQCGNIINIGAPLERIATPGFAAYCAAKYGVEGLTKVLAKECRRHSINVNILHPGGFADTRLLRETVPEAGRGLLAPETIGPAAVALAAQPPRARTGQAFDARQWPQAVHEA